MMNIQRDLTRDPEITLSNSEFNRISLIAKSGWGLDLDSAKIPLIRSRLRGRLKALELNDYESYCDVVESGNATESDHFISALTTNVSHFYREVHHFNRIEEEILPKLLTKARGSKPVRIWSAGCSTGQEPYSLAGSILALAPDATQLDLRILATDVDPIVLEKAKAGQFAARDCSFPSIDHEKRVFELAMEDQERSTRSTRDELKKLISFRRLNLVQPWPISGTFDLIMCRNVAIYFDKSTQNRLWSRFADALVPSGYLFIGHSERITKPVDFGLEVSGITTYRLCTSPQTALG